MNNEVTSTTEEPSMIDEINKFMLDCFKDNDIEDTEQNRYDFLIGLQEAWAEMPLEEGENRLGKALFRITLDSEIFRLKVRLSFPTLTARLDQVQL